MAEDEYKLRARLLREMCEEREQVFLDYLDLRRKELKHLEGHESDLRYLMTADVDEFDYQFIQMRVARYNNMCNHRANLEMRVDRYTDLINNLIKELDQKAADYFIENCSLPYDILLEIKKFFY